MLEEGSLRASGGASAFHHQSGAVRPTLRPTGHRVCHHVRSAGAVPRCVSVCVCFHVSERARACVAYACVCVTGGSGRGKDGQAKGVRQMS